MAATLVSKVDNDREEKQRPLDMRLIVRLFQYTKPYAATRNWLLLVVLMRALQVALLARMIGWIIDDLVAHQDQQRLWWGAAAFGGMALLTSVTFMFRMRLALNLGESVVYSLRRELFAHLQAQPMAFFHKTKLGRIISRLVSDVEAVRVGVQDVLFTSLVQGGQMVIAGIFMALINWQLFLVVLFMTPVLYTIGRLYRGRFGEASREVLESFSRITSTLAESVNGIRVTQGFSREEENARQFSELVSDHSRYNLRVAKLRGAFIPLLDFNSQVFLALMLLIGGYLVVGENGEIGDIVAFFFLANIFFQPIQVIGNQYSAALTAMAGAERVFGMLDRPPEWQDPEDALKPAHIAGRVCFKDVSFAYRDDELVLQDINFSAKPGETIALVGHTGSGKSSIINLISKFYLPRSGTVTIDEHDITQLDSDVLHRHMGIVLQSNFLFTGTVLDNIRVGRDGAGEKEAIEALDKLGCRDLLENLPDGLGTEVGEGGSSLSAGQRQLVCFARAMIADPSILILDEATSAVDTITEVRIQEALEVLLRDRTSFVVAHRLSTVRRANLVLVLEHGHIVERGSHHDLLESGGRYADLYRQFIKSSD